MFKYSLKCHEEVTNLRNYQWCNIASSGIYLEFERERRLGS